MKPRYKSVFLDADDTIFDYAAAERAALTEACAVVGLHADGSLLAAYRRHNARVWNDFENGAIDAEALKVRRFRFLAEEFDLQGFDATRVSELYLAALSAQTQMLPGAASAVAALSERWPLFLVTNGLSAVQRPRIAASDIERYFKGILVSEELGVAKPDPAIFATALSAAACSAAEVLFVGDRTSSDMPAAANAGMDFCWVNPAKRPMPEQGAARFIVRALAELPALLNSAGDAP